MNIIILKLIKASLILSLAYSGIGISQEQAINEANQVIQEATDYIKSQQTPIVVNNQIINQSSTTPEITPPIQENTILGTTETKKMDTYTIKILSKLKKSDFNQLNDRQLLEFQFLDSNNNLVYLENNKEETVKLNKVTSNIAPQTFINLTHIDGDISKYRINVADFDESIITNPILYVEYKGTTYESPIVFE